MQGTNIDKNYPLVAINCITYNHEPYIRDALEGFVMQKTNFPFVAIVHDDASTDGTAAIIREYAEKYPDIIKPIYETENQYSKQDGSLTRIMNAACEATGAKYIAMCEGDDYWTDPLKLQKQVDFLESHPNYSLCFTDCKIYDKKTQKYIEKKWTNRTIISFDNLLLEGNQITTLTVLVRQELIDGFSQLKMPNWPLGDYPLWLYVTSKSKLPAIRIGEQTAVYRVLEESASHSNDKIKNLRFSVAMAEIQIFFAKYMNISPFPFWCRRTKRLIMSLIKFHCYKGRLIKYLMTKMYPI